VCWQLLQRLAVESAAAGDTLTAHKHLLRRALVLQQYHAIAPMVYSVRSSAQLLHCLGDFNQMLRRLLVTHGSEDVGA
jgi:hypothetical protein